MKKVLFCVVAMTVGISACGLLGTSYTPVNTLANVQKGEGLMPLNDGRSWIYTGKAMFFPLVLAMRISGRTTDVNGKEMVLMAVRSKTPAGTTDSTAFLFDQDNVVRIMRTDSAIDLQKGLGVEGGEVGILYAPPKTEVKQTVAVGDEWTDTFTQYSNIDMKVKTGFSIDAVLEATGMDKVTAEEQKPMTDTKKVLAQETITVPFGTFEAFKIESHPNEQQTVYTWYAEGYGMIKQSTMQDGSEVAVLELTDMDSAGIDAYFSKGSPYDFVKKFEWVKDTVAGLL